MTQTQKHKIKVLLVEDHTIVAKGIVDFLNSYSDIMVVGKIYESSEIIKDIRRYGPDIILMDIKLPGESGIEITEKINKSFPKIGIVMLSGFSDESNKVRSYLAGAQAYVCKGEDPDKLVQTIRKVSDSLKTNESEKKVIKDTPFNLLPLEIEILNAIKNGTDYHKASEMIQINPKTFEYHLSCIYTKLGASNKTEAIYRAIQNNIISID